MARLAINRCYATNNEIRKSLFRLQFRRRPPKPKSFWHIACFWRQRQTESTRPIRETLTEVPETTTIEANFHRRCCPNRYSGRGTAAQSRMATCSGPSSPHKHLPRARREKKVRRVPGGWWQWTGEVTLPHPPGFFLASLSHQARLCAHILKRATGNGWGPRQSPLLKQ